MTVPEYLNPEWLFHPPVPISQMSRAGDLLFLSGQTGVDADGNVALDVRGQFERALENIRLALESQGATLRSAVRLTHYLAGRERLPTFTTRLPNSCRGASPVATRPPRCSSSRRSRGPTSSSRSTASRASEPRR